MKQKKIVIDVQTQSLKLYECPKNNTDNSINNIENANPKHKDNPLKTYSISTGKNGTGCMEGTGQTPLGKHIIAEKIGGDEPINSVFVGRVPTGEIYSPELAVENPNRDWILSRILWLSGTEEGINKGTNDQGCCDTYQRYIYIHGTPDSEPMGVPMSHGCVRMRNADVLELYELVDVGCEVVIG